MAEKLHYVWREVTFGIASRHASKYFTIKTQIRPPSSYFYKVKNFWTTVSRNHCIIWLYSQMNWYVTLALLFICILNRLCHGNFLYPDNAGLRQYFATDWYDYWWLQRYCWDCEDLGLLAMDTNTVVALLLRYCDELLWKLSYVEKHFLLPRYCASYYAVWRADIIIRCCFVCNCIARDTLLFKTF